MQINEEFWGGQAQRQTWVPGVEITNYTLLNAFNETQDVTWTLPLNEELDPSISPWAINKDADILKLAYPVSHRVGNSGYVWADPKFYSVHDFDKEMSGVPFYFAAPFYTGGAGYDKTFNWARRNGVDQAYISAGTSGNYGCNLYPVTNFDYSKLCVSLYVEYTRYPDRTGDVDRTHFDYYFNTWSAQERAAAPIVGIGFQIWGRGWDSNYPNVWRNVHPVSGAGLSIHSLGRKKPCEIAPSGSGIGYNVNFMDDFMSLVDSSYNGLSIGTWKDNYGGNGGAWIYDTSTGIYVQSYEAGAAAHLITSATNHPIVTVPMFEGEETNPHWRIVSNWEGEHYVKFKTILDASTFADEDELKAYILKQAAYLGMWFYTNGTPIGDPGSSESWYLGEIDENGVTTGRYKQGAATSELNNSTWDNPWEDSPWSGRSEDPTPWDSSQTSELESIAYDPAYGSEEYIVSSWALYEICRVLNYIKVLENEDFPLTGEIFRGICERLFGTTDPLESILSVVVYPLDIRTDFLADTSKQILDTTQIGNEFRISYAEIPVVYDTSAAAAGSIRLSSAAEISRVNWLLSGAIYGEAEIPYYANYKSFLDYEPYSSAELYVPYCGSVKIDPEIYIGHTIKVKYALSPTDGTVKAYIMRDNLVIDTLTGNMGAAVTLYTSDEVARANNVKLMEATLQSQKQNKLKQAASFFTGAAGILAGTATGGAAAAGIVSGLVSTAFNTSQTQLAADQTQLRIDTAETPFKQLQSGGGYLSLIDELAIRLVVYRPEPLPGYSYDNWRDYGHTTGFACLINARLDEFSGYTECSNVITDGIPCTATEKKMIIEALQAGVYL